MPISSHQVAGMIGGQQAAFGNFASYAQQISPYGSGKPTPTYSNPMQGVSGFEVPPPPTHDPNQMSFGARAMSGMGNIGGGAVSGAAMLGSVAMPGAAGRAMGMMDPYTAAMGGFSRGAGLRAGGQGIMANLGRIGASGARGIAGAGLRGAALGSGYGALAYGAYKAVQYTGGQMIQGAQYHGQIAGGLQGMRHLNPMAKGGFGFSRGQSGQIADMAREMGHSDMQTGPQELARIMRSGVQGGLFRAVQDVKEFKTKFKETVTALKGIAETMNTTLEGAMPFFQASRRQGFWTPQDITRNAQQTRMTAQATGMSVAAVQQMQAQGTQMARRVGALGYTGAQGMQQSMQLVGGGLRGGTFNEQELQEVTGMRGPAGIRAMSGRMQASATRFASSRQARWMMAAMGGQGFKSLDEGAMADLSSGQMGIGDISRRARRNIGREGAYNFVLNEKNLRGEMLRRGPEMQSGFIKSIAGGHLYGTSGRSKLITRKLIGRYFGVGGKQADIMARLARDAPRIMEENMARTAAVVDQEARNRDQTLNRSYEGLKRKASAWWDKNVKEPLQQTGQQMGIQIGDFYEGITDKFWGRSSRQWRIRGADEGVRALQRSAMGDPSAMGAFGSTAGLSRGLGAVGNQRMGPGIAGYLGNMQGGMGKDIASAGVMLPGMWEQQAYRGVQALRGGQGAGGVMDALTGRNIRETNDSIESLKRIGVKEVRVTQKMIDEGIAVAGARVGGRQMGFMEEDRMQGATMMAAAQKGIYTETTAAAMGFSGAKDMREKMKGARSIMESSEVRNRIMALKEKGLKGMELGTTLVEEIRSGKLAGGTALADLVKDGSLNDAALRMGAAQSAKGRAGGAGVDYSDDAKNISLKLMNFGAGEKEISDRLNASSDAIAAAVGVTADKKGMEKLTGWKRVAAGLASYGGAEYLRQFQKMASPSGASLKRAIEKAPKLRAALALYGQGNTDEQRAANATKAREQITKIMSEESEGTFTDGEMSILRAMGDKTHPAHAAVSKEMTTMSGALQARTSLSFQETVSRRHGRFITNMGERQEHILSGLNKATADSAERKMGDIVRELTDTTDPGEFNTKLEELTMRASEADPEQAARAAALVRGIGGGEHIYTAIMQGRAGAQNVATLTKKGMGGMRKGVLAANELMSGVTRTGTISKEEFARIRKEGAVDEKTKENILGRLETKWEKENARKLIEAIDMGDRTKMMEVGRAGARARSLGTLSTKDLIARTTRAKAGEIVGKRGSQEGIHTELSRQTVVLEAINKAVGGKKATGAPSDSGTGGGAPDPE